MGEGSNPGCYEWYAVGNLCYYSTEGSGEVCINGAAAHLVQPGDIVIILSYAEVEEENIGSHTPRIVLVNSENKISEIVSSESNF